MKPCHLYNGHCVHNTRYHCRLCSELKTDYLKKCIREDERFLPVKEKGSMAAFYAMQHPMPLLHWLGSKQAEPPKAGDYVVSMTAGFASTSPGVLLKVIERDNDQIRLRSTAGYTFSIHVKNWHKKLFTIGSDYLTDQAKALLQD